MPPAFIKKTELAFKQLLHRLFGLVLSRGDDSRYPVNADHVRSILILRPDKLGDMITTIPAAHALKKKFPHMRVEIMASPLNQQLVADDPAFDAVHLYRKNILVDLPLVRRLRKKRFDIIFDPICHDSVTGLLLTKLIGNGSIAAAARKLDLQRFYDYCEPYQPDGREHNIDNSLLIFNLFGVEPQQVDPFQPVYLSDSVKAKAATFVKSLKSEHTFKVGLNISAGSPTRTLDETKYAAMLDQLAREYPTACFIVVCTPNDRERGARLVSGRERRVHLVPDGLSLLEAAAVVGLVDLFISPDTSLIHIARLMKVPVVGLYSGHRRNYHFWKPYRQEHGSVVSSHEGHLHDIEPSQVVEEFRKVAAGVDTKASTVGKPTR